MPLIGCRRSLSCLYSWNAWAIPRTCASSRWGTWIATTAAPTTRGRVAGRQHGHHPLDEVAGRDLAPRGELPSGERHADLLRVDGGLEGGDQDGVVHVHDLVAGRAVEGDAGQPVLLGLLLEELDQVLAPVVGEEPLAGQRPGDVLPVPDRLVLDALVERLGHPHRLVERALDLDLEPPLDRRVDEVGRDQEDEDRRRQRQRQERGDQLGLEPGAQDLVAALEPELGEVPEEEDQEQEEDDQVQVEQRDDDDVGRDRDVREPDPDLDRRRHHEHEEHGDDDDEVALPLPPVVGRTDRERRGRGRIAPPPAPVLPDAGGLTGPSGG